MRRAVVVGCLGIGRQRAWYAARDLGGEQPELWA